MWSVISELIKLVSFKKKKIQTGTVTKYGTKKQDARIILTPSYEELSSESVWTARLADTFRFVQLLDGLDVKKSASSPSVSASADVRRRCDGNGAARSART